MSPELIAVVEPFVRRGLFPNAEMAAAEIARDYLLRQIERYRAVETALQARYGMTYEQFDDYLRARSGILRKKPNPALNQAIMIEEDDALDWKVARDNGTKLAGFAARGVAVNTLAVLLSQVVTVLQESGYCGAVHVLETHPFSGRQFALKVRESPRILTISIIQRVRSKSRR